MARRVRQVEHHEQLSVVEHLDELRWRLLSTLFAFALALGLALWQNKRILELINDPLPAGTTPTTFGVSEAFVSTLTVATYAAFIAVLPIVIYHVYAFVIPAFSPAEQKVVRPLVLMTPLLFIGGVVFGYMVVLPIATDFLLNFNDDQFDVQVRAREYYSFFGLTLTSIGLLFEIPVAILIATRLGIVTPAQLRKNRRYAVLVIAVLAMLLPGTDPISMLIEMVPLVLLFELSILLATLTERRRETSESFGSDGSDSVTETQSPNP